MKKTGFYIIKDKFFDDMSAPYLQGNKAGGGTDRIIIALKIQVPEYTG